MMPHRYNSMHASFEKMESQCSLPDITRMFNQQHVACALRPCVDALFKVEAMLARIFTVSLASCN
jgi:hypothetical protein